MTRDEFIKKYEEVWDKEYMDCWHYRFLKDNKRHKYTQITKEDIAMYNYQPIEIIDENKAEDRKILDFLDNTKMDSSFNYRTVRCIDPKTNNMLFTYNFFRRDSYETGEYFITHGFYYMGYCYVFEIDITNLHYDIVKMSISDPDRTIFYSKEAVKREKKYMKEAEKFYKENKQKILLEFKVAIATHNKSIVKSNFEKIN